MAIQPLGVSTPIALPQNPPLSAPQENKPSWHDTLQKMEGFLKEKLIECDQAIAIVTPKTSDLVANEFHTKIETLDAKIKNLSEHLPTTDDPQSTADAIQKHQDWKRLFSFEDQGHQLEKYRAQCTINQLQMEKATISTALEELHRLQLTKKEVPSDSDPITFQMLVAPALDICPFRTVFQASLYTNV